MRTCAAISRRGGHVDFSCCLLFCAIVLAGYRHFLSDVSSASSLPGLGLTTLLRPLSPKFSVRYGAAAPLGFKGPTGFMLAILILSGDVQKNPGPVKYPCGGCGRAVATTHRALQCDTWGGQGQGGGDQADPAPSTTPMRARSNAVTSTLPICPNGTGNPPTGRKWKGRSSGSKAGLSAPALFTVALTVLRML
uniref:Uncharacterized protein n=1 Tax=Branchiostoma floridae TaxID=7739 RepID=C3ZHU5_BRAFL|eukprot:XP_002591878.1 hypothetical protein BRAFLDRAFT_89393 [Branchiostoma floridae]